MLFLPRNWTRYLKNPWVDFHQTWYVGAPSGEDELIRFWGRSAQHQRSMNMLQNMLIWLFYTFVNWFSSLPSLSLGLEKWWLFFFCLSAFFAGKWGPIFRWQLFLFGNWRGGGGCGHKMLVPPYKNPRPPSVPYWKNPGYVFKNEQLLMRIQINIDVHVTGYFIIYGVFAREGGGIPVDNAVVEFF